MTGIPACTIQLTGRCLLVLPTIWPFRSDSDDSGLSGSVDIDAKLTAAGRVKGIRVVDASLRSGEGTAFLKELAVRNLKEWRFESGTHSGSFRVTYEFQHSAPRPGKRSYQVAVRLAKPGESSAEMTLSFLKP